MMVGFSGFLAGGAVQQANARRQQATADRGVDVEEDRLAAFRQQITDKASRDRIVATLKRADILEGKSITLGKAWAASGKPVPPSIQRTIDNGLRAAQMHRESAGQGGGGARSELSAGLAAAPQAPAKVQLAAPNASVVNPDGTFGEQAPPAPAGTGDGDSRERRIARLQEGFREQPDGTSRPVTRNEAIAVIEGRLFASRDPVTNVVTIGDKLPPIAAPAPKLKAETPSIIPEGANLPGATGGTGFFGGLSNRAADLIGGNLPFEKIAEGTEALDSLATNTMVSLAIEVPGKPSKFLLEKFDKLNVNPASLFQGDRRSLLRFKQMRSLLRSTQANLKSITDNPERFKPGEVTAARQNLIQTDSLLKNYDQVVEAFEKTLQDPKKGIPLLKDRVVGKTEINIGGIKSIWTRDKNGNLGWEDK